MQPHDLAFLLAGLLERQNGPSADDPHAAHRTPAVEDPGAWIPPPMHPQVAMPPAFMSLRPDVSPYQLRTTDAAPLARPRELMRLADGGTTTLVAAPIRRVLFGRTVTMLGFNGQYPGPLIQVDERSTITVRFTNHTAFPTAVHWHGLRLDNRFDGVPHVTQDPVLPGGTGCTSGTRASTGITRIIARTSSRIWVSTGTCWSARAIPASTRPPTAKRC
jgi:FtsP/CotA-like multicopper oxidase with cupredoxin domain